MKKISLNKGIRAIVYPFIFGIYLLFTPALARNTIHFSKFKQQPHQISGTVTDANGPIPGVTISIKGKKSIAITDFDGHEHSHYGWVGSNTPFKKFTGDSAYPDYRADGPRRSRGS